MWSAKLLVILLVVFTTTAEKESETSDYTYEDDQDRTTMSLDSKEYIRHFENENPMQTENTENSLRYIHVRRDENPEDQPQTRVPLVFLNASYFNTTTENPTVDTTMETKPTAGTTEPQLPLEVLPHIPQNSSDLDLISLYAKVASEQNEASVPPDQKKNTPYQRGVLDLLIPKIRLQTFKGYFNAFMRFLSGVL